MLDINNLRKDLAGVIARLEARKSPQTFLNVDAFTALETEIRRRLKLIVAIAAASLPSAGA